ncbi:hypothetical protein BTA51_23880 [Hahella sp. CCB-MM4]|uniref:DDE-type integrase/transposase/recombinase n=1 Tax=Hahella sp. (strain CCB-MM4) TaxID=1926491 RepID=UPI000B9C2009|nr:DDE-type integrase/transposase/recombinase [Hahella sp. CCB-MM4]OZG70879.1 hypothetical protein BTA51_23880 [Hahella sp. CCB-MM4]
MLELNDILAPAPDRLACIEGIVRVVAVSDDSTTAALIRLDNQPIRAPFNRLLQTIDPDIESNGIVRLETFRTNLAASKEALSKSNLAKYERALSIMENVIGNSSLIFDASYRGREFARIAKQYNVHVRTVRRHFYDYLWGGMTDLALAGPQKTSESPHRQQKPGSKKRGRKSKLFEESGQLPLPIVRQNLEKGIRLYYLSGKHTELESYVLTLQKYYSKGKQITRQPGSRIVVEDILLPPKLCPTFRQFRYIASLLKKTEGDRKLKPRMSHPSRKKSTIRGKARDGVLGPGYRYEIDATIIQIRIVSRLDPTKLTKEATLYSIIDVWSGAIVGYALSLQPASWFMAAKALRNCFTPKTDVFKRLDLPYSQEVWKSKHLPSRLAADRGELVSDKAGIIPELGIKLEIMPPMRPDRKGSVEGKFENIKHGDNFYMKPGKHNKNVPRRGDDGKKSAALTLEDLEAIIVEIIIDLNNDPAPVEHLPAEAINAGISAITYGGLFEWGLNHRAGFTRKLDSKVVKSELMLKDMASVTPQGLYFKKHHYLSSDLLSSGLIERASINGNFKIEVRYDDLISFKIHYLDPTRQDWLEAFNSNPDVQRLNASFWEIEEHREKAERLAFKAKTNNIVNKSEKAKRINQRNRNAIDRSKAAKLPSSRSQSKQAIRLNTDIEIAAERSRQLMEEQKSVAAAIASISADYIDGGEMSERNEQTSSTSHSKTAGQRALELWKNGNADLDK